MSNPNHTTKNKKKAPKPKRSQRPSRELMRIPALSPFVTHDAVGGAQTGIRVGFPASRRVKLVYIENATLTSTFGSAAKSAFRLNSAFDPWATSTGHQPMGFDQWSLFYNHYCVISAKWTATIAPLASATGVAYLGAHYSDDTTIPSTITDLGELGAQVALVTLGGVQPHIFTGHIDIGKFFNRTGDICNDDQLRALTTADPAETAFLTLFALGESSAASLTLGYLFEVEYDVKFMEPKDLAPSMAQIAVQAKTPVRKTEMDVRFDACSDEYEFVRVKRVI